MAMKLHQAKDTGDQYYLQVWLDDTKVLLDDEGSPTREPDPEWLREWRWGKVDGEGKPISRAMIQDEVALLARLELGKMNAVSTVVTLPEEGATLIVSYAR